MATRNHKRTATLRRQYELNREAGRGHLVEWLDNEEEIGRKVPFLKGANIKVDKILLSLCVSVCADVQGYNGMWLEEAGWVEARESLRAVGAELQRLGVKSSFGTSGTFKDLLLGGKDGKKVVGVRTADGTEWPADLVIMATGAWSPVLLDLEGQCISKVSVLGSQKWQSDDSELAIWTYTTHARRDEMAEKYSTPLLRRNSELNCAENSDACQGFFMEPTPEGVMKFSDEFEGYINTERCRPFGSKEDVMLSVPRAHALNPTDTIPDSGVEGIQKIIDTFLPRLSGRKLFDTAICWCTDSFDGNWLLCDDPRYEGLVLATGDSGHTFKMLPIVGKYVADLIEGKVGSFAGFRRSRRLMLQLSDEDKELWRWRPDRKRAGDIGRDGPVPRELREYTGWKHDQAARSKL